MEFFNQLNAEADKRLSVEVKCHKCSGRGEYETDFNGNMKTCTECGGEGLIKQMRIK